MGRFVRAGLAGNDRVDNGRDGKRKADEMTVAVGTHTRF